MGLVDRVVCVKAGSQEDVSLIIGVFAHGYV